MSKAQFSQYNSKGKKRSFSESNKLLSHSIISQFDHDPYSLNNSNFNTNVKQRSHSQNRRYKPTSVNRYTHTGHLNPISISSLINYNTDLISPKYLLTQRLKKRKITLLYRKHRNLIFSDSLKEPEFDYPDNDCMKITPISQNLFQCYIKSTPSSLQHINYSKQNLIKNEILNIKGIESSKNIQFSKPQTHNKIVLDNFKQLYDEEVKKNFQYQNQIQILKNQLSNVSYIFFYIYILE